jgi:Flp pilus assembly protein TadB
MVSISARYLRSTFVEGGRKKQKGDKKEGDQMLWTIAVILIVLWALGLVSSYTMGGFIHLLLIIALIVVVVGFLQGRRAG